MRLALLAVALLMPVTGAGPAAAAPTKRATCDEVPGQNLRVSARWRVFYPVLDGRFDDADPLLVACRRGSAPMRRWRPLGGGYAGVSAIAGDLLHLGSGRYGNVSSAVIDLATGRSLDLAPDGLPEHSGYLLGSGATMTPSQLFAAMPSVTGILPFGGDDDPGAGLYLTTADGGVQRQVPGPPLRSSDWPEAPAVRWQRKTVRVPRTPGLRTTLPGQGLELVEHRARPGHRATLVLHRPDYETILKLEKRSDVVTRLAPGSRRDLELLTGCGIVARFADHPWEPLLRVPGLPDRPATDGPFTCAPGLTTGIAIADPRGITVRLTDDQGRATSRWFAAPGAKDVAMGAPSGPRGMQGDPVVLYIDAAGVPQQVSLR